MATTEHNTGPVIADEPPVSDRLTDYDHTMLIVYLRLLDAEAEGADWTEATRIVLRIDPASEPDRAVHAHATHLARAHWMTEHGYRHLLSKVRAN